MEILVILKDYRPLLGLEHSIKRRASLFTFCF